MNYDFAKVISKIHNSGQTHSLVLCGNIYDLFFDEKEYVPLIPYLLNRNKTDNIIQITYELNGPIRIVTGANKLRNAWITYRQQLKESEQPKAWTTELVQAVKQQALPTDYGKEFDERLSSVLGKPALALELLRNFTICSRNYIKSSNLFILVEGADMILPVNDDISKLSDAQLHRIAILQDWFQDPEFISGGDTVCLIAESMSLIHSRVARLPQLVSVEVSSPNLEQRLHYIQNLAASLLAENGNPNKKTISAEDLAKNTAGLSLYALRQIVLEIFHSEAEVSSQVVIQKVEEFIKSQVGEDIVEFKKPEHKLDDCVGFSTLKKFLKEEFIPRVKSSADICLSGAGVAGPIGGGKTFIFEAVASELGIPVLVLKNIRSQWYGQTDVIFERLKRVLEALEKVCIFVDEADTQFGSVSSGEQATERRLTGKIQAMMSDPKLKGRIIWLLMTARIHLLSPDIRRPGRVGDLIIPVLDPEGEDRTAFVNWTLGKNEFKEQELKSISDLTKDYSAAAFASLRSNIKAIKKLKNKELSFNEIKEIIQDLLPAEIGTVREFQNLQALLNCTRRSLLPQQFANHDINALREIWAKKAEELNQKINN